MKSPHRTQVRVFRVTTPIEAQANGSPTGKTLSSERLVGNRKADLEKIVKNAPFAAGWFAPLAW